MKISFGKISLNFKNIYQNYDDERLRRLSHMVFSLLDEKLDTFSSDEITNKSANNITLDQIVIPAVFVNPNMSDYEIAYRCASAIYQAILDKLR
jgi:6-phosphogluconolactonase/glucosamine-6-phosphate isomerase/deaminase